MTEHKEDYRIFVRIFTDKSCIENVSCRIFLPKRLTGPIELYFYPDEEQRQKLEGIFEFSMDGELKGFSGETDAKIASDKVYVKSGSTVYWGQDIAERKFSGTPMDLKITEFFHRDVKDVIQKIGGNFWLTPSIMLTPMKSIERSYTGNVKVETSRRVKFTLANSLPLIFDEHFRYLENEDSDCVSFTELVVEFEMDAERLNSKDIENNVINYLDDFLMLVSFAERHRCACLGWEIFDHEARTKYYRRNVAIPDTKKKTSSLDTLVDISEFVAFMEQVYTKFTKIEPKDLIRQAIQYAIYREDRTVESSFLTLYTSLETLLLYFRRTQKLETVFVETEWEPFQEGLKQWLKNKSLLADNKNKERRALIYEKLPELNRVSFSTAFKQLCDFYSVDLSDLWPVVENSEGISLSEIRNKLIHGETFNLLQLDALSIAGEHLRWIVERLILSLFGWPHSRSYVNKDYLSHYIAFNKEWKEGWKILSGERKDNGCNKNKVSGND